MESKTASELEGLQYEYLEVLALVENRTSWEMTLNAAHVEWGKFDEGKSPVNVPANGKMEFSARGRDSSPSGTNGYATWTLKDHPAGKVTVKAAFSNPAAGFCKAGITCEPAGAVSVKVEGKSQNSFKPHYTIG